MNHSVDAKSKEQQKGFLALVKQFFKFGLVGISNTLISLGVYYLFIFFNPSLYMVGYILGFLISVLNAYFWNNKYVFQKTKQGHLIPLLKTYLSYGITFGVEFVLLFVMVNFLHVPEALAPIINLAINIPLNFLLNKFWAFK